MENPVAVNGVKSSRNKQAWVVPMVGQPACPAIQHPIQILEIAMFQDYSPIEDYIHPGVDAFG